MTHATASGNNTPCSGDELDWAGSVVHDVTVHLGTELVVCHVSELVLAAVQVRLPDLTSDDVIMSHVVPVVGLLVGCPQLVPLGTVSCAHCHKGQHGDKSQHLCRKTSISKMCPA